MLPPTPDRLLKKAAGCVLASFGSSTYPGGYASAPHSLRPCRSAFLNSLFIFSFSLSLAACDGTQHVALTAEDFRFTPEVVRVNAAAPLTLTIYNAGREVHEFDSPVLMYAARAPSSGAAAKSAGPGILLEPGKSLQLAMAPPPGTYLYICRRKGHANMTGTLIVEQ